MNFYLITIIKFAVIFAVLMTSLAYLQWVERKVLAHIQLRLGPYRVGPHGFCSRLADVIKLITKEDLIPPLRQQVPYLLAPLLAVAMALISISRDPLRSGDRRLRPVTHLDADDRPQDRGPLRARASRAWASTASRSAAGHRTTNTPCIGGLRSSAQMISYELPMALAIAAPLLISNTLSLREMVEAGRIRRHPPLDDLPGPFPQIVGFIIFMIAAFAETNRVPFDLPEAENELVAGFHTEYSTMKFAAFFMAEYANMVTISCRGDAAVPGRLAAPVARGSTAPNFVPVLLFALAGAARFYHGDAARARRWDKLTSRSSASSFWSSPLFS